MTATALLLRVLLLALSITLAPSQRLCTVNVYNIAVESNSTLVYLNSIKSLLTPADGTGSRNSFNFTYFPISPKYSSTANSSMTALFDELQAKNIHAIVADYYLSVAVVAYSLYIPYFIGGRTQYSTSEYRPNMFRYEVDHNQLNTTLYDLSASLKLQMYTVFTDGSQGSSYFTANLAGKLFTQSVINSNTTDSDIFKTLLENKDSQGSHCWVLVYKPENFGQIERIFNQSGPAGILTDSNIFIIPSLVEKQDFLANVRKSSAAIYTFMLENSQRYSETQLTQVYLKDCFAHFGAAISLCQAVNSPNFTLVSGLLNASIRGDSGYFAYRQGIRYNMTIKVMTTDSGLPESNFLAKAGTWVQSNVPAYIVEYYKTASIKNSYVRFAAVIDPPYLYRNLNGELTGISYDLIQLMQKSLQFQYEFIFVPDGYGLKLPDGNWTGIMKYLVENKADMSANFLSATPERLNSVDLSINLMQSGLVMLLKRSIYQLDFFTVFHPFSWYVWISIVFSMIVLSVTLFVSDKISPNKMDMSLFTFMDSFFLVLSSFLMSKVETEPRKPSARLFTLLLWFSTLFYMTTYVSNLVPFLVKPDDSVPFSSITELQNASGYKAIFINNSLSYSLIQNRWPGLVQQARKGWSSDMLHELTADAVRLVQTRDRFVFVDYTTTLSYEKSKDCSLKTVGPLEELVYETILISRNFQYQDDIRTYLNSIRYSDYQNLEQKYFGLNRCPTSVINPADKMALNFNYFAGLFVAVGIGSVLGFLYILLHWVYRRVSLWLARRKGTTKLKYGMAYEAEIIQIKRDGVWVRVEGRQEVFFIANNSLHSDPTRIKNAKSLNLRVRQKMQVQYFGRDSATNNRIFARLFENSEWLVAERNRVVDDDSD